MVDTVGRLTVAAVRHRVRKEGGRSRVGISTHSPETMRASSHPRGAGRRRGKLVGGPGEPGELAGRCRERLVRDSGEPGELADAEEDWSVAQGS